MFSPLQDKATKKHFEKIGFCPHHGIAAPLFSLKTKNSLGIGQYLDLIPLIDFIKKLNMDVIQLLPLNDTGSDPSPYSAISSCALNPIFLDLLALPYLTPSLMDQIETLRPLNDLPFIDYAKVRRGKNSFLKAYYEENFEKIATFAEYQVFVSQNPFLHEYALFCVLKKKNHLKHWDKWEKNCFTQQEFSNLLHKHVDEINYYLLIQYLCYEQLSKVKKYSEEQKVLLKGDVPILLTPDSADVWAHRSIFDLSLHAGAPPDAYASQGQNWHFPLFNWEKEKESRYHFWKRRLAYASNFFDLYRIDHVVGFFRIWGIDKGKKATQGKFVPNNLYLWEKQGETLLQMMLDSSSMLPIAEDLGTIPVIVYNCLKKLGICGTRVLRWECYYEEDCSFIPPENYQLLSLTTTSTHDSEPLKLWWEKFPSDAKAYSENRDLPYEKELSFSNHVDILKESHHTASLFHINPLQDYLTLFKELSHSDLNDERINTPGTHNDKNWAYRFKPSIEDMTNHKQLIETIREIID